METEYRIMPPLFWYVGFVLLFCFTIYAIVQVLFFGGNVLTFLLIALFLFADYGYTAWESKECVRIFESKLK